MIVVGANFVALAVGKLPFDIAMFINDGAGSGAEAIPRGAGMITTKTNA